MVEGLERLPVHPTTLAIFGATGDLARRKLLPAIYNLAHDGALPERLQLVGLSRSEIGDEAFREMAAEAIRQFSRRAPDEAVLQELLEDVRYVAGTFDDDAVYETLAGTLDDFDDAARQRLNRCCYLSTAPALFPIIVARLGERAGAQPPRRRRRARGDREAVRHDAGRGPPAQPPGAVPDELAVLGHQSLTAAVNGFTRDETAHSGDEPLAPETPNIVRDYLASLPGERFPNLVDLADHFAIGGADERFELLVDAFAEGRTAREILACSSCERRRPSYQIGGDERDRAGAATRKPRLRGKAAPQQ
ncbi:MAG: hypothetical protein ACXVHQ_21125 [Solirubrobacteraceae bacterium]